ncbi:hypothetical protein CBM2586_A11105 [Cupriavidus phytorum]|uniref:Uncharacterized protein n=1 Tax=Cupriavidus taiwanensis TaxID=164546 RepID=A0A375BCV6_9BURK|nr:hypothetical protein CBM2586_A11105 [Cupriavidus taiwanensis]
MMTPSRSRRLTRSMHGVMVSPTASARSFIDILPSLCSAVRILRSSRSSVRWGWRLVLMSFSCFPEKFGNYDWNAFNSIETNPLYRSHRSWSLRNARSRTWQWRDWRHQCVVPGQGRS